MSVINMAASLGFDRMIAGQILSIFAALSFCAALYIAATSKSPMAARLKGLEERRKMMKSQSNRQLQRRGPRGSKAQRAKSNEQQRSDIRIAMDRLKLLQDKQVKEVELTLSRAGFRSRNLAVLVILARLLTPLIIGGFAVLLIFGTSYGADMGPLKRMLIPTAIFYICYLLPDLILDRLARRRLDAISLSFSDTLDLLVICAEAGLTIDAALQRVSRELAPSFPEMSDELRVTSIELNFMTDRRVAFQNFAQRVPIDTANAVATTLIQTEKYGTPLASALRVLSAEFRHDRMMKAEAKAARLPVLMTIPMMFFLVPPIFIIIIAPAACTLIEHSK